MEDPSRPRRDMKILWLLPILALGVWVFFAFGKKPLPKRPTEIVTREQAKYDAYLHTKYLLLGQVIQGQPKGVTLVGFAPYSNALLMETGPGRFHCASSLTVRSPDGTVQKEHWQCFVMREQDNWTCVGFQHTPPERLTLP